jgi:GNAT superfamily N-acetyltransferase
MTGPPDTDLMFALATEDDVPALAALRATVATHLTRAHGRGHWSSVGTEAGMARTVRSTRVLVARNGGRITGMLTLATRKPWAIDTAYFTPVDRPLYLVNMAVDPISHGHGVGRRLLDEAAIIARSVPAQSIRLDAYDAPAGAGPFYAKCGYREVGRVTYRNTPLIYYERLL